MIKDTYSASEIQCFLDNIDKGIKYFERERDQAATRLYYEYFDGFITGLMRAKYLFIYMRGRKWNLPSEIIKEDNIIYTDTDSIKIKHPSMEIP